MIQTVQPASAYPSLFCMRRYHVLPPLFPVRFLVARPRTVCNTMCCRHSVRWVFDLHVLMLYATPTCCRVCFRWGFYIARPHTVCNTAYRHCCFRWGFDLQVLILYETPPAIRAAVPASCGAFLCTSSSCSMCTTADMLPSFCLVRALHVLI